VVSDNCGVEPIETRNEGKEREEKEERGRGGRAAGIYYIDRKRRQKRVEI